MLLVHSRIKLHLAAIAVCSCAVTFEWHLRLNHNFLHDPVTAINGENFCAVLYKYNFTQCQLFYLPGSLALLKLFKAAMFSRTLWLIKAKSGGSFATENNTKIDL